MSEENERAPRSSTPLTEGGEPEIEWAEASERITVSRFYWLASTRPDGAPHVRPVLGVWVDGAMWSTSNPAARKARNLEVDGRCALTVRDDQMDLVLEGEAQKVSDPASLDAVAAAYLDKYGWPVTVVDGAFDAPYGAPTAGPPPYEVYRITPTAVFAFGTDESLGPRSTRFRF